MTTRTRRALAWLSAATLTAGGTVALAASPALAQRNDAADLGVTLTGTALAATATRKVVDVTVTNAGPGTATGSTLVLDLTGLDRAAKGG